MDVSINKRVIFVHSIIFIRYLVLLTLDKFDTVWQKTWVMSQILQ
jgi:hypothetical protein